MDDHTAIKISAAPPPIDVKAHEQALRKLGLKETLGMAMPANARPTPGLLSYLHDPARRAFAWNQHTRITFGEHEASDGVPSNG